LGRSQLADLDRRVARRREHFAFYRDGLSDIPGVAFPADVEGSEPIHWLTVLTIDPDRAGADRETVRLHLESLDVESRPVWKPMHLQPYYADCVSVGGGVSGGLFELGLCLPSGSTLGDDERDWIVREIRKVLPAA
jgi:dTDP-4-amino-4,6-dideoxygalactose transaminase